MNSTRPNPLLVLDGSSRCYGDVHYRIRIRIVDCAHISFLRVRTDLLIARGCAKTLVQMQISERDEKIDTARALGILLVLYSHALEMFFVDATTRTFVFSQWQVIFSFHMPLFFFISGLVYRPRSTRDVLASSLNLILLAYVAHVVGWLVQGSITGFQFPLRSLLEPMIKGAGFSVVVVWFLVAIAFVQITFHILMTSRYAVKVATLAVLVVSFVAIQMTEKWLFQAGAVLPGLLFYAFGHWFARSGLSNWQPKLVVVLGAVALVMALAPMNQGCLLNALAVCGQADLNGAFGVRMVAGKIGFLPLFLITAALSCLAVLWISARICERLPALASYVAKLGTRTLDLLLINAFVFQFVQPFIRDHWVSEASLLVAMSISAALTLIQVAALPVLRPALALVSRMTQASASALVRAVPQSLIAAVQPKA